MRERVPSILLAIFAVAASAQKLPSAQRVIDEYIRAQGGAKALAQIQTETLAGSLTEESTGKTGSYSRIVKSPNRFYSEVIVEPDRTVDAYNGMSAWGQNAQEGMRTLANVAAKEAEAAGRLWNGRLVDLKKDKINVQLLGVEKVRARDAYHVRVLLGPGVAREVFFDTQTHLVLRESAGDAQIDYDDYRAVPGGPAGMQAPYRIELHHAGHDYKVSVTRAEFNSPVDDSVFNFPRASGAPLPDIKALILDIRKNQEAIEKIQKQYTCHAIEEEEKLDSKGQPASKTIKEFEVFYVAGEEVRRLIATEGKALTGDAKKKEEERFNKEFEKLTKAEAKKKAELAADPKKREQQQKEEAKAEAQISDFLRAMRFSNPRRERFRGQDVVAVDFGPNPDYKPKKMIENIIQKLVGVMWIDEQARDVVRLEAHFSNSVKIGAGIVASLDKGSNFAFEQARVNDEVWLPIFIEVHMGGRFLFFKAKANQIERYSDYKKFSAESKFLTAEEAK